MGFLKRLFGMKPAPETPALLAQLDSGSPKEIADALNVLAGRLQTLHASERDRLAVAARHGLDSPEDVVRGQAMFAIGELGEDAALLLRGLDDPDWFVRLVSVSALARVWPKVHTEAIARLRDDPEPLVRDAVRAVISENDPELR